MGQGPASGLEWKKGQAISASKLNRMVNLAAAASPALNLASPTMGHPTGNYTNSLQKYQGTPVLCKVVSNRTCGGEYNVIILNGPVSDVTTPTFNIDDFNDGLPAVLQNIGEAGTTGHTLAADVVVMGLVVGRAGTAATGTSPDAGKMLIRSTQALGGILDERYNLTTHAIEVTYVSDPGPSDWVIKVQFYAHEVLKNVTCDGTGGLDKDFTYVYDPEPD